MVLALWIAFTILTAVVASSKGRSFIVWGLLGALFGIFALICVALMPAIQEE